MQPEVGRQVDHRPDPVDEPRDQALGLAVGQGAEDEVEAVEGRRVGRRVDQRRIGGGQRRGVGGHRLAGVVTGGGHGHLQIGVGGAEP